MALRRFGIGLAAVALCLALVGCEDSCPSCSGSATQVRGYVRDASGIGLEGETVHVLGKPPVLTGSDGSFVFDDVTTPYDLVYESDPSITVWRGVTRLDPVINGYTGIFGGPVDTALVSGDAPALPERRTKVFFLAPDAFPTSTFVGDAGDYFLHLGWLADGRSRSGRLLLLRFLQDPSTQRVLEYDGFEAQSLEAQPGGVYYIDLSSISDPLDRSIAGTVAVPTGYVATSANFWMEAQQQLVQLDYSLLEGLDFAFVAPTLPDATYRVGVEALSTDGRYVFTARGGLQSWDRADIAVRSAPEPLVPQQDQVIGRTTPLSWRDDGAPALHIVHVHSTRRYVIHVVGTETRLDDLPGPWLDASSLEIYRIDGQNVADPSFSPSGRSGGESFATSESVRFRVASEVAAQR